MRDPLFHTLRSHGLRNQFDAHTANGLRTGFRNGDMDLIITTPEVMAGDLGPTLQKMRHSRLGENPFVVVITLVDNADPDLVRQLIEAGADDVLLLPIAPSALMERLDGFVIGRKPFVVTHDYVGPDRRLGDRIDSQPAATLEVPNPVRWQVVPNSDKTPLSDQIRHASARINVHKMKCYAVQVAYLVEHIVDAYVRPEGHIEMLTHAANLANVSEDLAFRMSHSGFAHAGELALSLCSLCGRLARADRQARDVEVEILPTLARAIQRIFDEDPALLSWVDTVEAL
jgi:DNA-binding response OmpR family regulator